MEYYEGLIRDTEFFTTAELAKKLKMNVQVITRKIQSGEIAAYKIGKDWRIPEQSVFDWLEQNSNGNRRTEPRKTKIRKPAHPESPRRTTRHHVLEYILAQFEPGLSYSATEVTRTIARYHDDHDSILQEFVSEKMLECIDGQYRRRHGYSLSGTTIPTRR
ncbi:MAG: helix-turn-helix domain-containing protein [candidate division Zixibacteria bacterium]|nr:helix-turn-helix domain-containing protein [candidate division Zixibacteria bacterium]